MSQLITFSESGDLSKVDNFLEKIRGFYKMSFLDDYGRRGVELLKKATPVDTGKTAKSWYYKIERSDEGATIEWCNSNVNKGQVIALLIQYGHGTKSGKFVKGYDYINPVMRPYFDELADKVWKEVNA